MENAASPRITAFNCPNCAATVSPNDIVCAYCGSSLATRICGACFGAVCAGSRHCSHCGANLPETKSVDPERALKCSRCEVVLELQKIGGQLIHICPQCGGLWLDKQGFRNICEKEAEQKAVLGYTAPALTPKTVERSRRTYIPCPECGKLMNQKNFAACSGIILDWCRDHGIWFDRHELHSIVTFIREGGMRLSRQKEIRDLREQRELHRLRTITDRLSIYQDVNHHVKKDSDLLSTFVNWLRSR